MQDVLISPDQERVQLDLDAYCHTCKHRHKLGRTPQTFTDEMWAWEAKHRDHEFEFLSPRRIIPKDFDDEVFEAAGQAPWWLEYKENADVKIAYAGSTTLTCTLASLASSATFVAGREATSVVNTSTLYMDVRVTAKIMVGTTPTVDKDLRIYAYASLNDVPAYPDTITGTDSAVTITNTYILDSTFVLLGATSNAATSNISYTPKCLTLAEAFGFVPKRWGLFIAHSQVAALHATGSNHVLSAIGAYFTVI